MAELRRNGIYAILITPLTESGEVDEAGVRHLVDFCSDQGFSAAVVLGSNGEFPYLSLAEKLRVINIAGEQAKGRIPIVAGVSDFSTAQSLALTKEAQKAGCAAVLAALTVYFKVDFQLVLDHFRGLSEDGGLPVFFYYFPDTTGLILTPEQIARIADLKGVIGAKFTVTSIPFLKKIIEATRGKDFSVFTGTSFLLRSCLDLGGAGVFCPLPTIAPQDAKALIAAQRSGEAGKAQAMQDKLRGALPLFSGLDHPRPAIKALFALLSRSPWVGLPGRSGASHPIVKEALRLQGHPITNMVKRPYQPVSEVQSKRIGEILAGQGWL